MCVRADCKIIIIKLLSAFSCEPPNEMLCFCSLVDRTQNIEPEKKMYLGMICLVFFAFRPYFSLIFPIIRCYCCYCCFLMNPNSTVGINTHTQNNLLKQIENNMQMHITHSLCAQCKCDILCDCLHTFTMSLYHLLLFVQIDPMKGEAERYGPMEMTDCVMLPYFSFFWIAHWQREWKFCNGKNDR